MYKCLRKIIPKVELCKYGKHQHPGSFMKCPVAFSPCSNVHIQQRTKQGKQLLMVLVAFVTFARVLQPVFKSCQENSIIAAIFLQTQNRDYNRSPTPVYDMAPFLHCACVGSAIFLASKTAASNSKFYGESFGQCKKTAIKS